MPRATRLRRRSAERPRPDAASRRQRRSSDSGQHTNRPQTTDEVDGAHDPQPRIQTRPELAQCRHPLAQPAPDLHHLQAKLAEHAAVHILSVKTHDPAHECDPSPLGPTYRTLLVEDQILRPALTAAILNRRTHQARTRLIRPCTLHLTDHRLSAIWHMAHRVQCERPAVRAAPHLPQRMPRPGRPLTPAGASNPALTVDTR